MVPAWLSEPKVLDSSTLLRLDGFHALWNLYNPKTNPVVVAAPPRKLRRLGRNEALQVYPIGTRGAKWFGEQKFEGQVYGYRDNLWRVRYQDNDWEEMDRRDMGRFVKGTLRA